MPRQTRAGSGPQHPYQQQQMGVSLAPSPMYPQPRMSMPDYYGNMPAATGPPNLQMAGQPLPPSSYDAYASHPAPAVNLPPSHRPSSGAWTIQDDQQLMAARAQGLNWGQIKDTYFPTKTSNACRKRHERLAERRDADDWDQRKLQRMAKEYMTMRKEIWAPLAARTGEKWNVVEAKCMANGLKNLQSAARAASRHDRLTSQGAGGPLSGYDDDSGISGIGLTPVDELDASYSSPETGSSSGGVHSASSSTASAGFPQHPHAMQHHNMHGGNQYLSSYAAYGHPVPNGHRYSSSVSSTASQHQYGGHSPQGSPYMPGQRLPSVDMGIGAIINRPGGM